MLGFAKRFESNTNPPPEELLNPVPKAETGHMITLPRFGKQAEAARLAAAKTSIESENSVLDQSSFSKKILQDANAIPKK